VDDFFVSPSRKAPKPPAGPQSLTFTDRHGVTHIQPVSSGKTEVPVTASKPPASGPTAQGPKQPQQQTSPSGASAQTLRESSNGSVVKKVGPTPQELQRIEKQRQVSYTQKEAALSIRLDPHTNQGPWHIDTSTFTSGIQTANGGIRNAEQFWKQWMQKYPETLSSKNLEKITRDQLVPTVDAQWIKFFPEHQYYMNEKLVHHHIDHGVPAIPLPEPVHAKNPGRSMFHQHFGGKK
jgi:hypothetical protein